jgi:methyl-accepting chemotaxis protein
MSVSGSIAEAVETFRKHAARKRRDEIGQSRARAEQASGRQAHLERLAGEFERTVGGVIEAVGAVVAQLEHASQNLSRTSSSTDQLARTVAGASKLASGNVQSVAAATEKMSASVATLWRSTTAPDRPAQLRPKCCIRPNHWRMRAGACVPKSPTSW